MAAVVGRDPRVAAAPAALVAARWIARPSFEGPPQDRGVMPTGPTALDGPRNRVRDEPVRGNLGFDVVEFIRRDRDAGH